MRPQISMRHVFASAVFILAPLAWGAGNPAVPTGFGPWQKAKVGEFMTLQVPGKFKVASVDLSAEVRQKIDSMETYSLDNANSDDYQCLVTYINYNKGILGDLDGAAAGAVGNMQKDPSVSDFKVAQKYINHFKMKGISLEGSFKAEGKQAVFHSVIYVKRNVLWMLMIVDTADKKIPEVSKAIIDSLQITGQ